MIPPSANDDGEDQISKSIAEKLKEVDPISAPDQMPSIGAEARAEELKEFDPSHDSDPIPELDAEARLEWPLIEADRSRRAEFGLSLMLLSIFVLIASSLIYSFDRPQGSVWFVYAWVLMLLGTWYRDKGRNGMKTTEELPRPRTPS